MMMGHRGMIQRALSQKWARLYVRFLAVLLTYGALMHVRNIVGWTGRPWRETPVHWRVMDIVLWLSNAIVAIGLWGRVPWAVVAFVVGSIALQIIPYTVLRPYFAETPEQVKTINGLVVTMVVLLALLVGLVAAKR
jgi:hypothetical protein